MDSISERPSHRRIEDRLWADFGPLMDGRGLCKVLHFKSVNALNVAHSQGRLPFPVFNLAGRRGLFARTLEVACWLEESSIQRTDHSCQPNR